jgi:hypothetical protein
VTWMASQIAVLMLNRAEACESEHHHPLAAASLSAIYIICRLELIERTLETDAALGVVAEGPARLAVGGDELHCGETDLVVVLGALWRWDRENHGTALAAFPMPQ